MEHETQLFENGTRVVATGGPYEGRHGEVVRLEPNGQYRVRLDDYGKMALINESDLAPE